VSSAGQNNKTTKQQNNETTKTTKQQNNKQHNKLDES
jgi:hypothetical protein